MHTRVKSYRFGISLGIESSFVDSECRRVTWSDMLLAANTSQFLRQFHHYPDNWHTPTYSLLEQPSYCLKKRRRYNDDMVRSCQPQYACIQHGMIWCSSVLWSSNFLSQGNPSCKLAWLSRCWFIGWDDHSFTKMAWSDMLVRRQLPLSCPIRLKGPRTDAACDSMWCNSVQCVPWSAGKIRRQSRWALFDKLLIIHNLYHFLGYYKSRFVVLHLSTCRLRAAARLVTAAILSGGCHQPREKDCSERAVHLWATQQCSWWVPGVDSCCEGTRVWLHWPALRLV